MTEWIVKVSNRICEELENSFQQGPVWEIKDGKGIHFLTEETVARINGVKIEVFSNEHPPPHFRVKFQSSTENFSIEDCSLLNGSGEIMKYEKNIYLWWQENKENLINAWNRLRPSDCPVGEYREDEH